MTTTEAVIGSAGVRDPATNFPCFDGLRAVAAITVVLHHASFPTGKMYVGRLAPYFTHLDIGVAVFFLISGFLLYRPFVAAAFSERSGPSVRRFFRRRLLRIFPAYWLALVGVIIFFGLQMPVSGPRSYFEYFTLTQVYDPVRAAGGIAQAWTLSIELSFYTFIPLYAYVMHRLSSDRRPPARLRLELGGLVVLYATSIAFRGLVFALHGGRVHAVGIYWLPANLDYFALGMGLAVVSAWLASQNLTHPLAEAVGKMPLVSWGLALACFVAVSKGLHLPVGLARVDGIKAYTRQFLYGATAFFLLLPAVFGPQDRSIVRRFLRWGPVVYLGLISYGIYLWHQAWIAKAFSWQSQPMFKAGFVALLTTAFAWTLVTASASWFLLERPLLRSRHHNGPRGSMAPARSGRMTAPTEELTDGDPRPIAVSIARPLEVALAAAFVATILGYAIWAAFTGHGRFIALRVGYGSDSVFYIHAARAPVWTWRFLATPNGGPFLFLVLAKLCLRNLRAIVLVQSVLAAGAWIFLAHTVAALMSRPWLRAAAFVAVLLVGLSPSVIVWNATIATESLAISLLVVAIALSLRVATGAGPKAFTALLVVLVALACTRDTNDLLLLLIAVLAAGAALTRASVRRRALVLVAVCVIAAGVNLALAAKAQRWYHPLTETIALRVLGSESATNYFVAHGMPYDQPVRDLHTNYLGNLWDVYTGAQFQTFDRWVLDHGRSTYLHFLATHPGWTFGKAFDDRQRVLAPALPYGVLYHDDPRGGFRVIGAIAFPGNLALVEVWIGAALVAAVALWHDRRRRNALIAIGVSALLVVGGYLAAWHGDALEIERHSLGAAVQLRLVVWVVTLLAFDAVLSRTGSVEVVAEPEPHDHE